MRNLKKILALVLSLMMVLSVMVTASAADYSDADDIQYTEAVEVMSALGILSGADGKFVPQGTLYRDQAAKIIAYIKLGADADALLKGTGSDQFVDVTGGWAYDYVSYCANEGIINGYTVDGKLHFGPGGTLTGYQFGKMVLNAAGVEGNYTGAGWELRVATALKDSGLKAGLETIVLSANITREQACQLAFNAMNYVPVGATTGKYVVVPAESNTTLDAAVGDEVFGSRLEAITFVNAVGSYTLNAADGATNYTVVEQPDTSKSLMATAYSASKKAVPGIDDFGHPYAKVWLNADGEVIYSELMPIAVTYTGKVTAAVVAADLGLNLKDSTELSYANTVVTATANGKVVDVYPNLNAAGKHTGSPTLVTIVYTTGKLEITEKSNGDIEYKIGSDTFVDYKENTAVKVDTVALMGKVSNGEAVTYVKGTVNTSRGYIYPTTVVEGVLSGKNATNETLTVGGKKLSLATGVTSASAVSTYSIGTTAQKFALDQYGYVVSLAPDNSVTPIPTQFVYVYAIEVKAAVAGSSMITDAATEAAAKALVAFTDGTVVAIDLNLYTKNDNKTYYGKPADDGSVTETEVADVALTSGSIGYWFGYTVNEDGSYTLAVISNENAKVVTTEATVAANKSGTIESKVTNSATSYLAVNTADRLYAVTEATGLYGAAITVPVKSLITYAKDSKVISNVYMVDTSIGVVTPPALDYALAVAEGDTVAKGTEWTFILNGEEVTYVISSGTVAKNNVYTLTEVVSGTTAGTYTASSPVLSLSTGEKKVTVADDTFFITDSDAIYYTVNTQVFNVSEGHTGEADTLEVGDYVVVKVDSNNAVVVYIVDAPAS